MTMSERRANEFEYLRPLRPLHFPVEAKVPESQRHYEIRSAVYQLLSFWLRDRATVGSDQFMYFDASDPKACLAPDVFVQLGTPGPEITSWKTWERGTPDLAIEIASRSDAPDEPWNEKLARYHRAGVRELVRFDQKAAAPLRVWDYVDGDLAERKLTPGEPVACPVLSAWWVLVSDERWGRVPRLALDAAGTQLVKTEIEVEAEAKQAAQARVEELEAELRSLRG